MSPSHDITPHRRTVLKTAAWGLPAIAVATAAPAFAASGSTPQLPSRNAAGGTTTIDSPAGTDNLEVSAQAWYNFVSQTSTIAVPALTAVLTVSGGWITESATFSTPNGPLSIGQVVTEGALVWTVTAMNAVEVTLVSAPATLPGSTTQVKTPEIWADGKALGTNGTAAASLLLTGIGAVSTNPTNTTTW